MANPRLWLKRLITAAVQTVDLMKRADTAIKAHPAHHVSFEMPAIDSEASARQNIANPGNAMRREPKRSTACPIRGAIVIITTLMIPVPAEICKREIGRAHV